MFKEEKPLLDVAIILGIRADEIEKLYLDFWKLKGLHGLNQIYNEVGEDIHTYFNITTLPSCDRSSKIPKMGLESIEKLYLQPLQQMSLQ